MGSGWRVWFAAITAATFLGVFTSILVYRHAPGPVASSRLGTDDVFGRGLHERQFSPTLHRWTTERAVFAFRDLPEGPAALTVSVQGHRDWVAVAMNGRPLDTIEPGRNTNSYEVAIPRDGRVEVELRVRPFVPADGRRLGAQLGRVELAPLCRGGTSGRRLAVFVVPALAVVVALLAAGWGARVALVGTALVMLVQAVLLRPWGVVWSSYAYTLAAMLAAGAVIGLSFARLCERRWPQSGRWAVLAALSAWLVQGVAATWPAMLVSDAMMNAHNLERVAAGDWQIVSRTQHSPPFLFPYGPAFYGLLVPLQRAGLDALTLVRGAAGLSGVAGSLGLFGLLASRSPIAAAAAVCALQLLPGIFDRYSYGNLTNVFAQSMTVLFFAWWTRRAPGGPVPGAVLLALAGLGHFSGAIVLTALLAALLLVRGGWRDLPRWARLAVVVGGVAVIAYYATFLPLMLRQLPRVLEGSGQGPAGSVWGTFRKQLDEIFWEWGLPAVAIAWAGRPRGDDALDRDLRAFWLAGAALGLLALVSPVEARYLYALTLPLAAAAGQGALALARRPGPQRWVLGGLVAVQVWLAVTNLHHDLFVQYRG